MIPGLTSKLSEELITAAATIYPKTDMITLTGTTDIATISPNFGGGFSGLLIIVPTGGAVNLLATGNIAAAVTAPNLRATLLVYSKRTGLWYPGAIS